MKKMNEILTLENKSNSDYVLEYISGNKQNFLFLFGGDKRIIKNKAGEAILRISTSSHGLKDFSFFSSFPGKLVIQPSENDNYDFIYDINSSKKINLKFTKTDIRALKKDLITGIFNIISFDKLGRDEQKKTLDKSGIKFF